MDAHRRQMANRRKWSKKNHEGNDDADGGEPDKGDGEGDVTRLMQRSSSTPIFGGLLRWQEAFELLPPRRRSTRAFLILEYLEKSAHFRLGSGVLGVHLRAVRDLLTAMGPTREVAVEDTDVAWSVEVWGQMQKGLDAAMLELTTSRPERGGRKRVKDEQGTSSRNIRLKVSDGMGAELGGCCVGGVVPDATLRVEIHHDAEGVTSSSSNGQSVTFGSCVIPNTADAPVSVSILPAVQRDVCELWNAGLLDGAEVANRIGDGGLAAFVDKQQTMDLDFRRQW